MDTGHGTLSSMEDRRELKPLLDARAVIRIEDFCEISGLSRETVEDLMRAERITGGLWRDDSRTAAMGMFEDEMPLRAELLALNLPIRDDYESHGCK
jgi:hypothetical protein